MTNAQLTALPIALPILGMFIFGALMVLAPDKGVAVLRSPHFKPGVVALFFITLMLVIGLSTLGRLAS